MAITSLIAADTAAADAELDVTGTVTIVATKLIKSEQVTVHVYGLAGDTEQARNNNKDIILTRKNNSSQLVGPCKYHVYKSVTKESLGVGYHA